MKKQLYSEIEIESTPERVWQILSDTGSYPKWNPFIRSIDGKLEKGEKLNVFMMSSETKGMTFKPRVLNVELGRELKWLGNLVMPGLFDGEHFFRIEPIADNRVKFIHGEKFSGLLVRLFAKTLDTDVLRRFKEMNEALKKRCEEPPSENGPAIDWAELARAGKFEEAEAAMLEQTEGNEGRGPDAEARGWFYETWGDALAPSPEAEEKYRNAHGNFAIFASWSTSGGEGTARMMDVNRVLKKIEDLDAD